jgi:hypothetical protein
MSVHPNGSRMMLKTGINLEGILSISGEAAADNEKKLFLTYTQLQRQFTGN